MTDRGKMILGMAPLGIVWGRSSLPAIAGLVLPFSVMAATQGPGLLLRLTVILLATLALHLLFTRIRHHPIDLSGAVTATILATAVPPEAPLYQLLLAVVFGVVIGEQVFGGRGRAFLNPAIVSLAFLTFSFADQDYRTGPVFASWTLIPAFVFLLVTGQAAWRILLAAAAVLVLAGFVQGNTDPWAPLLEGSIGLTALYLAADPVSSAATNPGRWIHGLLVGGLAALFSAVGPAFGAMVFAVLLASTFAPLVDRCVITIHAFWRERRYG